MMNRSVVRPFDRLDRSSNRSHITDLHTYSKPNTKTQAGDKFTPDSLVAARKYMELKEQQKQEQGQALANA